MQFLIWPVLGLIVGRIIDRIMSNDGGSRTWDFVAGIAGAVMGGLLASISHPVVPSTVTYNGLAALLGALVFAIVTVIARDSRASATVKNRV